MADVSAVKLPNGTTYTFKDSRLPASTAVDSGKIVGVSSTGTFTLITGGAMLSALTSAELDTVLDITLTRAAGVDF